MPIIEVDPALCTFCGACLELCTGEVYGENSVDVGGDGGGWSRVYANHRQKGKALPEYKTKGTLEDPTGHYIHPWYFDGVSHRQGAARALTEALSL